MGFRGPRLGSCSGIGLSVRLEKQGPARRARRLTNRAGSVAARTEVGSHPAVADRRPNHAQDTGRSSGLLCSEIIIKTSQAARDRGKDPTLPPPLHWPRGCRGKPSYRATVRERPRTDRPELHSSWQTHLCE